MTEASAGSHSGRLDRRQAPRGVPGNARIAAISDGVFPIAITLLVLNLRVPDQLPSSGLAGMMPGLLPQLGAFVLTFVVVGVYWVGQHNMFLHIHHHDRILLWLNLLFLLFVVAMPFFADLIVNHLEDELALTLYTGNLVCAGLALDAVWWYASSNHRLVDLSIDPALVGYVHRRVLTAPAAYLISIAVSLVSQVAAMAIIVAVPVSYIVPTPWDHLHHRAVTKAE